MPPKAYDLKKLRIMTNYALALHLNNKNSGLTYFIYIVIELNFLTIECIWGYVIVVMAYTQKTYGFIKNWLWCKYY